MRKTTDLEGLDKGKQEESEKRWPHSPLRAATRRIAIHQVSLLSHGSPPLSHAACASMSTTTTTTRDRGDRYGPIEWVQQVVTITIIIK